MNNINSWNNVKKTTTALADAEWIRCHYMRIECVHIKHQFTLSATLKRCKPKRKQCNSSDWSVNFHNTQSFFVVFIFSFSILFSTPEHRVALLQLLNRTMIQNVSFKDTKIIERIGFFLVFKNECAILAACVLCIREHKYCFCFFEAERQIFNGRSFIFISV